MLYVFVQTRAVATCSPLIPTLSTCTDSGAVSPGRPGCLCGRRDGGLLNACTARTLWRGTPLAGIGESPLVASRVVALEDEFLSVVELYADIEYRWDDPPRSSANSSVSWRLIRIERRRGRGCRSRCIDRVVRSHALDRLKTVRRISRRTWDSTRRPISPGWSWPSCSRILRCVVRHSTAVQISSTHPSTRVFRRLARWSAATSSSTRSATL